MPFAGDDDTAAVVAAVLFTFVAFCTAFYLAICVHFSIAVIFCHRIVAARWWKSAKKAGAEAADNNRSHVRVRVCALCMGWAPVFVCVFAKKKKPEKQKHRHECGCGCRSGCKGHCGYNPQTQNANPASVSGHAALRHRPGRQYTGSFSQCLEIPLSLWPEIASGAGGEFGQPLRNSDQSTCRAGRCGCGNTQNQGAAHRRAAGKLARHGHEFWGRGNAGPECDGKVHPADLRWHHQCGHFAVGSPGPEAPDQRRKVRLTHSGPVLKRCSARVSPKAKNGFPWYIFQMEICSLLAWPSTMAYPPLQSVPLARIPGWITCLAIRNRPHWIPAISCPSRREWTRGRGF